MSLTNQVYETKSGILAALQANPNLAGVDCFYAYNADAALEFIVLGDVEIGSQERATFVANRKTRDEEFEVPIEIYSDAEGADAATCELRATELAGYVEDMFADDPHFLRDAGVNGILWAVVSSFKVSTYPVETGYQSVVELMVSVRSRLN